MNDGEAVIIEALGPAYIPRSRPDERLRLELDRKSHSRCRMHSQGGRRAHGAQVPHSHFGRASVVEAFRALRDANPSCKYLFDRRRVHALLATRRLCAAGQTSIKLYRRVHGNRDAQEKAVFEHRISSHKYTRPCCSSASTQASLRLDRALQIPDDRSCIHDNGAS